jgi:SAM-dependent methyltransferase
MTALNMNSPQGKALLAAIRGGDYAHPGEEEAIARVWSGLPKRPAQAVLAAGCGRAGTAACVQRHGWGRVIGFDVDETSIAAARTAYPELTLAACDVLAASAVVGPLQPEGFAIIYLFSSFYAFPDQPGALRALRQLARPGANLALFDYTDPHGRFVPGAPGADRFADWRPLRPASVPKLLTDTGWRMDSFHNLTADFQRWYAEFLEKIAARRAALDTEFGAELVDFVRGYYTELLDGLHAGRLGGALVYANAV